MIHLVPQTYSRLLKRLARDRSATVQQVARAHRPCVWLKTLSPVSRYIAAQDQVERLTRNQRCLSSNTGFTGRLLIDSGPCSRVLASGGRDDSVDQTVLRPWRATSDSPSCAR
jgi:intergrase/recombinase